MTEGGEASGCSVGIPMTPVLLALAASGVLDGGSTLPTGRLTGAYVMAVVRMAEAAGRPVVCAECYRDAVLLSAEYLGGTYLAHAERLRWRE